MFLREGSPHPTFPYPSCSLDTSRPLREIHPNPNVIPIFILNPLIDAIPAFNPVLFLFLFFSPAARMSTDGGFGTAGSSDAQQSLQSFWPRVMEEIRNLTVVRIHWDQRIPKKKKSGRNSGQAQLLWELGSWGFCGVKV